MNSIKKVLIAEDELLIAKVLRMQLENLGFEVMNVTDANKAVEIMDKFQPDLIILDNYLKNKTSGIDAAYSIRKLGIETPIIFVTGNSFEITSIQTKTISNSKVLSKPIIFEELIKHIELLENKQV
jgi:DNA-binding response OmpR family regulator